MTARELFSALGSFLGGAVDRLRWCQFLWGLVSGAAIEAAAKSPGGLDDRKAALFVFGVLFAGVVARQAAHEWRAGVLTYLRRPR